MTSPSLCTHDIGRGGYDHEQAIASPGGMSLASKTVLITGGANGLGGVTARSLAKLGADVVVLDCMSPEQCRKAWRSDTGSGAAVQRSWERVSFRQVDLTSLSSVRLFAKDFLSSHAQLDCLVLNAGVVYSGTHNRAVTEDGLSKLWQINFAAQPVLLL